MKRIVRTSVVIFVLSVFVFITGCGKSEEHKPEEINTESSLVRDYDVNVASLDENKDGKVFQWPMDWQVISDEAGSCLLCNMKLKEYSVEDAQANLTEYKQLMQ